MRMKETEGKGRKQETKGGNISFTPIKTARVVEKKIRPSFFFLAHTLVDFWTHVLVEIDIDQPFLASFPHLHLASLPHSPCVYLGGLWCPPTLNFGVQRPVH